MRIIISWRSWLFINGHVLHEVDVSNKAGNVRWKGMRCIFCGKYEHQI